VRIVGAKEIELRLIKPLFPREVDEGGLEELAKSVEAVGGILEPVIVRPSKELGFYDLICGYRRYLAFRRLGLTTITAIVVECDDKEALQLALIENLQREGLGDYEVAKRLRELRDRFNLTPTQIAQLLGKSKGWVEDHLRMLELEGEVAEAVSRSSVARATVGQVMDKLTQHHARAILEQSEPVRKKLVEQVVEYVAKVGEPPSVRSIKARAFEIAKGLGKERAKPEEGATVEAIRAPQPAPPSTEVEKAAEPQVVVERTAISRPEDVDRFFGKLLGGPSAVEEAKPAEAPAPTAPSADAFKAVNDLLSRLREALEALCKAVEPLRGRRVRVIYEPPYGLEEAAENGVLAKADRRGLYLEIEMPGGAKAEKMIRWSEAYRVEAR
jgi:ParB family chromosome partitioning protein